MWQEGKQTRSSDKLRGKASEGLVTVKASLTRSSKLQATGLRHSEILMRGIRSAFADVTFNLPPSSHKSIKTEMPSEDTKVSCLDSVCISAVF